MKTLGTIIVVIVLLYVFLANFSIVESKYECDGAFVREGVTEPSKLFFRLEEYRLLKARGESAGTLWIEVPNEFVRVYFKLVKLEDIYQIYLDKGDMDLQGNFSALSNALALNTHKGFYDGYCKQL